MEMEAGGNAAFDSERLRAKEKKRTRRDSAKSKEHGVVAGVPASNGANPVVNGVKRPGKFGDRKSRSLYGRGLPKKGGGGGKGTWGKLGDEMDLDGMIDDHDPNYDSGEQDEGITYKTVKPQWNRSEIEKTVIPILNEYFEHAQKAEVMESLGDLNIEGKKPVVAVCLITLAMERKGEFRELASELLKFFATPYHQTNGKSNGNENSGQFRSPFMNKDHMKEAFCSLRECLPELLLDTPDAAEVLGKFMARAIFDHVLQKDIIKEFSESEDKEHDELAFTCAKEANCLLSIPHNNLKHVWGVGGGNQPLEVLKQKMSTLLKEYLSSGDSEEAMRCVKDLDVPHYNHELVYELVVMAIEVSSRRAISMMVHLLKRFSDTTTVTVDQITQGMVRVYTEMPDINLDVPNAYVHLEDFVSTGYDLKVIPLKLKLQAPNRSRKRFVSEGDGGRVKNYRDNYFDLV